ncbi:Glycosyl-hydrolase 97 C-terminal, oligomerisation [Filimonas lacunae]|uniref:Glycosyl-hydrolase 97 C-terminal, oligomerisation n=1 Tax=Filimonas lacunae TaxID=477680 RepID=A0A173MJ12_9BACT|nr:glycoside hydrolase family 97 protein [Filimonas lacunae]BAV07633.1 alpha-glucosidase SusB [Filimonas lacunae]SIT29732.1 Glycosyl-hydrolase 97 C-terminal, oligomerisation [Filimonas lacunae]
MTKLKQVLYLLAGLALWQHAIAQPAARVKAAMGKVQLQFDLDKEGAPQYAVWLGNQKAILPSALGLVLQQGALNKGFTLLSSTTTTTDTTWQPVWGEQANITDKHTQVVVHLQHQSTGYLLDIVFRVFADGVGFRYQMPQQKNLLHCVVTDESTAFRLPGNYKAFWIPGDYDTNEYEYTTSRLTEIDNTALVKNSTDIAVRVTPDNRSVQTPLMLKGDDGLYINIHEAALINYPAMQLHVSADSLLLRASLVPDAYGNKAYVQAPFHTPWRTIIISDKATDILASKMILNLNEPSKAGANTSWIQPMKFAGVWWEMQTGLSTWSYATAPDNTDAQGHLIPSGKHGANTANVKRYIDFAAESGIPGVLVEGWNVGWEDWFGNWKENVFDFVTPYPDFDVTALQQYAAAKGVHLIMHNETSGSATNYERNMDTAFRFMKQFGYPAVKTGYVGKIIPRGEHHDGQWMVNHYERVAQKALQYQVMLDAHEAVRPTGLQRTYPNWMACEAGRGNEYNAFTNNGNAPEHETILPFTRLMGGPMDYTPGIFKLKGYAAGAPDRQLHTTLAKQLALYVTIYSPLQMVSDLPENYRAHPDAFRFIKEVAVDWDDTKILEAEPGDYVTIARKAKGKPDWFIGGITDENSRVATVNCSFLEKGKQYQATIYEDAANAHWKNNPEAYHIRTVPVNSESKLSLPLSAGGGVAVHIALK